MLLTQFRLSITYFSPFYLDFYDAYTSRFLWPLFNGPEVLSSASDEAKLFAEYFSRNANLDDTGISLPVFPSRTDLKLHNIPVIPKMVKKFIMNLDWSNASSPDCVPVVVLQNCEPELSYILAGLFSKCLKSLVLQIVRRFYRWSMYLRMLGKGLQLKTATLLVFFLWLVKSLKNLKIIGLLIT